MSKIENRLVVLVISLVLTGCATGPDTPLIFGASNTVGISIGASAREQGVDFVVGYKGQDFAMVPVTAVKPDGGSLQLGGTVQGNDFKDAFSVFGHFSLNAGSEVAKRQSIGKFFATGLAASNLSEGYREKLGGSLAAKAEKEKKEGGPGPTDNEKQLQTLLKLQDSLQEAQLDLKKNQDEVLSQQRVLQEKHVKSAVVVVQKAVVTGSDKEVARGKNMYFAQYSSFGLIFSASPTDEGGGLTIGWKDRNLAIVPVVQRDFLGEPSPIFSKHYNSSVHGRDPNNFDAYSVLGQFEFDKENSTSAAIQVGLGKFFTTGVAARRLSEGFKEKLNKEYAATQANLPPAKSDLDKATDLGKVTNP